MEARELRIGNYVVFNYQNEKPKEVEVRYVAKDLAIGFMEPIPLTEEWLFRFGFEKCDNEFWFFKGIFSISPSIGHYEIVGSKLSFAVMRNLKIQFVHQLQNLYFALTGEELTTQELNQLKK